MGVAASILDLIYKITPTSDLLSYKGCLKVEQPQRFGTKKRKIEATSVEK